MEVVYNTLSSHHPPNSSLQNTGRVMQHSSSLSSELDFLLPLLETWPLTLAALLVSRILSLLLPSWLLVLAFQVWRLLSWAWWQFFPPDLGCCLLPSLGYSCCPLVVFDNSLWYVCRVGRQDMLAPVRGRGFVLPILDLARICTHLFFSAHLCG